MTAPPDDVEVSPSATVRQFAAWTGPSRAQQHARPRAVGRKAEERSCKRSLRATLSQVSKQAHTDSGYRARGSARPCAASAEGIRRYNGNTFRVECEAPIPHTDEVTMTRASMTVFLRSSWKTPEQCDHFYPTVPSACILLHLKTNLPNINWYRLL